MEDPLQSQRLKFAFESEKGLLGMDGFLFSFLNFLPLGYLDAVSLDRFHSLFLLLSFDAPEQQRGQQTLLPVCEVPGHTGTKVCTDYVYRYST